MRWLIAPRPAVAAYAARMAARPGFAAAGVPVRPQTAIWLRAALRAWGGHLLWPGGIVFLVGLWLVLRAG